MTRNDFEGPPNRRTAALRAYVEESDYPDLGEWLAAEHGRDVENIDVDPHDPEYRYVYVQVTAAAGCYGWLHFLESVDDARALPDDEWVPVEIVDLDTGDLYQPSLRWTKYAPVDD